MIKVNNDWTLNDLTEAQREHLAWRLVHRTYCGLITACAIARLEHKACNDLPIYKLFMQFDMTEKAAKIHACKVINFSLNNCSDAELVA